MIAEDSPTNLLNQMKTENLEEAFVKLCENQDRRFPLTKDFNDGCERAEDSGISQNTILSSSPPSVESVVAKFMKFKALTKKNFIQTVRRPA